MSARERTLALAATTRPWATRFVDWVADHGTGMRLRDHSVFERRQALEETYDCLLIEAESSLLDPAFVMELLRLGRAVVGIWDPELPESHALLSSCQVRHCASQSAEPEEIAAAVLAAVAEVQTMAPLASSGVLDADYAQVPTYGVGRIVAVTGAIEGVGATELAVELSAILRRHQQTVILVDADLVAPCIAQRLRMDQTRNIALAADAVSQRQDVSRAVALAEQGGFDVIVGLEHPKHWMDVSPDDIERLLDHLRVRNDNVIVQLGSALEESAVGRHDAARRAIEAATWTIVVAEPSPIGLVRLCRWFADAAELTSPAAVHVVFNRSGDSQRAAALEAELLRTVHPAGIWHLPTDRRVDRARYAGELVHRRSSWSKGVRSIAAGIPLTSSLPRTHRRGTR